MIVLVVLFLVFFFFQAEDGIRDRNVTGVQTCALPICPSFRNRSRAIRRAATPPISSRRWRSEERRVGKECRIRGAPDHEKKKEKINKKKEKGRHKKIEGKEDRIGGTDHIT